MKHLVGHLVSTLQTPVDTTEQLQSRSYMPQDGVECVLMGLPTASGQVLQHTAACRPDEVMKMRGLGCTGPTDCSCGPRLCASADVRARPLNSYMIPLHPTKPSLPPQHRQQPCSHIHAPAMTLAQQLSEKPATAPAPSVVESFRNTLPQPPSTGKLPQKINASMQKLNSHSMLLPRLLHLGSCLAEAARLGHLQRMHIILQLLGSCPVSAQLLASSQVAVTARHVLKQLQQQHGRPRQQKVLPSQQRLLQEQLRQQVAETAQQLLQQWRAVLIAEVASANMTRAEQARQVLSHLPPGARQPELTLTQQIPLANTPGPQQQMTGVLHQRQQTGAAAPADTYRRKRPALQKASQVTAQATAADDVSAACAAVSKRQRTAGQQQLPPATAARPSRPVMTAADKTAGLQMSLQEGSTAIEPEKARPKQGPKAAVREATQVPKVAVRKSTQKSRRTGRNARSTGRGKSSGAGRTSLAAAAVVTSAPQAAAGPLPTPTVAAAAAGNNITSVPGTWLKLDLGTTTILPKGRKANSPGSTTEVHSLPGADDHHQLPPSAAAAAPTGASAVHRSAMWGAGAKALRAVKGPGNHHGHGHTQCHTQHKQRQAQQQSHGTAGEAGAVAASHVGAAVCHTNPPMMRHVTTATHGLQHPSGTDSFVEHVGDPLSVTAVAPAADDLWVMRPQAGSQAKLPDHTHQQKLHPPYAGFADKVSHSEGFLPAPLTSPAARPPAAVVAGVPTGQRCEHNWYWLDLPPPAAYTACASDNPSSMSAAIPGADRDTLHSRGVTNVMIQPCDDYSDTAGADDTVLVDMRQQECSMLVMDGLVLSPAW